MLRRFALGAAALIVCAGVLTAPAAQAAITVNTTADPGAAGQCSLRKAIQAANTQSAAGDCAAADPSPATTTIIVPAGTYTLTSQLEIVTGANVDIQGASSSDPSQTTIDAAQNSRVLMVDTNAQATLSALTLTGGHTANGAYLGCCQPSTTTGFDGAPGGDGGGVYNSGTLTLTDAVVKGNSTGAGGRGGDGGAPSPPQSPAAGAGGQGGRGGNGGGIYNDFYGTLTLTNTTVTDNHAGVGGNGGGGGSGGAGNPYGRPGGAGGQGGSGGGIFSVVGNHVVTLTRATVSANTAGDGGDGNGGGNGDITSGAPNTGAGGGDGGSGGDGGGLAVYGPLTITQSTASANVTGIGGTGGGGGSGGNGARGSGGLGGGGGNGGGVLHGYTQSSSSFSLTNSTVANNTTGQGGNGGGGGFAGTGGRGGDGGGVWTQDSGTIVYATIADNHTRTGGFLGGGGARATDGAGAGLWIQTSQPTASAANTVFASNTVPGGAQNCAASTAASVGDGGHNLSFPDATCPGVNGDPALGPLQDNGGPTQTMALGGASAALDQIPSGTAGCPGGDQRGVSRPYPGGGLCDIGAFELGTPSRTLTVTTSGTGSGTVTGSGIDCGGAGHTHCSETVLDGTTIALSTTAAPGSSFATFTGGGCGAASPCTVTMNADKTVDAKFNQLPPDSIVAVTPASPVPPILTVPTTPSAPTAPSVTNVTQAHGTWRDGNLLAHLASTPRPPVGTTFTFALSEPARVSLAFTQSVGGRKVRGRCVLQTNTNRRQRVCPRTVTAGTLSFIGHSGTNRVSFQGRISRTNKLKPGRYTLTITATNAAGQHSIAKALSFTIVK